MDRARESHWQSEWARVGLPTAHRDPGKEKFYALVAYPGASGFLHLGHLRGLTYADALHRFYRMRGRAVFFPSGTHATGLPAVTFAQKVRQRDPRTVQQLEDNGIPQARWPELEDPARAARFLGENYQSVFRELGLLIDGSAYVTTIDEDYQAFIRWQFRQLERLGVLGQAPHYAAVCPVCGPVSVDPSETDLSAGGTAEWVTYTTVPFRLDDGRYLLAATLRPETVFGATNVWIPETGDLVVWHLGPFGFLVSPKAGPHLVEQHGGHVGVPVSVRELAGLRATAPLTGLSVPVIPSSLVNPSIGTGVVMSVPAHAPVDWIAVRSLPERERRELAEPPEVVVHDRTSLSPSEASLLAGEGLPAARAARAVGASSLGDTTALTEATERLYRLELLRGRMRADLEEGRPVAEARPRIAARLAAEGTSPEYRDFSEPVICRNGHDVLIRKVPDQWFIRYGDPVWKSKTKDLVTRMSILPEEYGLELPGILDWFADRPCTRQGRWLGTPFPRDERWIIEPIADSTFYPAYFPLRRFVARGEISTTSLTDAFFDFVLLGRGPGEPSIPRALQEEVRAEFLYWYPLDMNIGGKEHKRVHFPVFLATHALLLPPELQPRGVFVHWWLTNPGGGKISKKDVSAKGGAIPPMQQALERWGADALRLFHTQSASPGQDVEWDPALVDAAQQRIEDVGRLAALALGEDGGGPPELDRWLESRAHEILTHALEAFSNARLREGAELVYAELPSIVRRYLVRGGTPGPVLRHLAEAWVRLLSPITPHLAEELGAGRTGTLVAAASWPVPDGFRRSEEALASEELLETLEEDLRAVFKSQSAHRAPPDEAVFFVAAPWKRTVEAWMREADRGAAASSVLRNIMERAKSHPELSAVRAEIPKYVNRVAPLLRAEPAVQRTSLDEYALLRASEAYLLHRFSLRSIGVYREELAESHDPLGRRERARPARPAFYLFGGGGAPHSADRAGSLPPTSGQGE